MRTRNNKNNLSQSKTNNESNYCTNKNDINIYLNKYIFNKKKTRNRNDNALLSKKTFNLSTQKCDMNGSINASNNTFLNNCTKNINQNKNTFLKSRNKIPSCLKGRPNTIFNKNNNVLISKIKKQKILPKDKNEVNSNLKIQKRNISMKGYSNIININLNNNNNNFIQESFNSSLDSGNYDENKEINEQYEMDLNDNNKIIITPIITTENIDRMDSRSNSIKSESNNNDSFILNIKDN